MLIKKVENKYACNCSHLRSTSTSNSCMIVMEKKFILALVDSFLPLYRLLSLLTSLGVCGHQLPCFASTKAVISSIITPATRATEMIFVPSSVRFLPFKLLIAFGKVASESHHLGAIYLAPALPTPCCSTANRLTAV